MSVLSVHASAAHSFSNPSVQSITLLPNLGAQGDAHAGATVQHRSRLHIRPPPPNLRQVHLLHAEILAERRGTKLRFIDGHTNADDGGGDGDGDWTAEPVCAN
ncbi:hypothetical protein ACJ73_01177 [Blastomyces percursus]|uniref:MOSC domain-containing protein n=1 Tax=Blastomyces percursus TaxID=1658174 RepID=A0A1J9QH64_9EURO|nr:hypothetical protein ACJ73_01177 [Blastomyces percursus]